MTSLFKPECRAILIGSMPVSDHAKALDMIFEHTPEIPVWPQLPIFPEEGMVRQFSARMPGLVNDGGRIFVDAGKEGFELEMTRLYEEYLSVTAGETSPLMIESGLDRKDAPGFFALLERAGKKRGAVAVKGQITGPFTFTTGLKDRQNRAIFYDENLRDAAVKLLCLKAIWQTANLLSLGIPAIIFIDEPALAGFGTSEFIGISEEQIAGCLGEVISAIHYAGGISGIHVCANTDWSIPLNSGVGIVNFDAHGYFDRFIIYDSQIKDFVESGGMLAWGIVPTSDSRKIKSQTEEKLYKLWESMCRRMEAAGIKGGDIHERSLITPSCGLGSLPEDDALYVMELTRKLSKKIRGAA